MKNIRFVQRPAATYLNYYNHIIIIRLIIKMMMITNLILKMMTWHRPDIFYIFSNIASVDFCCHIYAIYCHIYSGKLTR